MFFEDTQESAVPKIAVIGCGCSTATEPVAEIIHYWNITQVYNSIADTPKCLMTFYIHTPIQSDGEFNIKLFNHYSSQ